MLIGLVSDTHIRVPNYRASLSLLSANTLPPQIMEVFRGVDLILHAGDIYTLPVLDELECLAPILASEGDDDPFEVANDKRVKWRHVLTVEGVTIWLAHQPEIWHWDKLEESPDVIVFGHSHEALLENHGDILRVNPGSPTFPHYKHELGTVGLLTVNSGRAEAQIIQLEKRLDIK
ncbi:MAG: metallophosphoesterase family protein [Chloroflexi bacterium]|nr:metallophosphoesterase family protein [Chloroflexota bacterium]